MNGRMDGASNSCIINHSMTPMPPRATFEECACQLTWSRFFITARGNVMPYLSCYLYGLSQLSLAIVINVVVPWLLSFLPSFPVRISQISDTLSLLRPMSCHNPLWVFHTIPSHPTPRLPKSSSSRRYARFATIIVDVNHKKEKPKRGCKVRKKEKKKKIK